MNTLLKRILSVFGVKPKNVIYDYNPCKILTTKRALLYFKTSWYFSFNGKFNPPSGSTNFESYRTALALNKLGYLVTIVNRNTKIKLKGKFDLYYGLAVGESGRHFEYYFRMTKNAPIKIALSTGASQHITVKNYQDRVTSFEKRNNFIINESVQRFGNISFNKLMNDVDAIFYHGHDFTLSSYSQVNTKKYQIPSPIKDGIIPTLKEIQNDKLRTKKFFFYSGSGLLHKGLDLIIEAFADLPDYELYIAVLKPETWFINYYKDILSKSPNIKWLGSMKSDSKKIRKVAMKCGFVISASCSDADPVSIIECMRYGMIPIVTKETDISIKNQLEIKNPNVRSVKQSIILSSKLSSDEIRKLSIESFIASLNNYSDCYGRDLEKSLAEVINHKFLKKT